MTVQLSFSGIENELLHGFRKKIGTAESTEDVKKFFVYTMQELFLQVFSGNLDLAYEDISLETGKEPPFALHDRITTRSEFMAIWHTSDLSNVMGRFSESSLKHYKHLEKNPEKTEKKMRN